MHRTIRKNIEDIILSRSDLLLIPVKQRAKFEGWLKFELACCIAKNGGENVLVETSYDLNKRSDISFEIGGTKYFVELKTPNANWRVEGVANKGRPITKNIQSIIDDTFKLRTCPGIGIISFVLFPIPFNHDGWKNYIQRIAIETNTKLDVNEHFSEAIFPFENSPSGLAVCCFQVNSI